MSAAPDGAAPEAIIHADAQLLARAVAARVINRLVDAQAARGSASLVLTGGGIGMATLRAIRESPILATVDWRRVDIWWGDERFVERDSDDRNEKQARDALLDHVDVDPARVFPMGWAGGEDGTGPAAADAAAARYAATLASRADPEGEPAPRFDVLLLGLGPEGHTASMFPDSPASRDERSVVGVHNCPKPPPTRISMTFPALRCASEVWMVTAGGEKADAVRAALSGADRVKIPAAGALGRDRTLWLLDRAAAAGLERQARRNVR
jgi:6-phosphogluconolactonase